MGLETNTEAADSFNAIYILGDGRSGSTLLNRILAANRGFLSVGELKSLYGHIKKIGPGEYYNWKCTCGAEVENCIFWKPIIATITGNNNGELFNAFPPFVKKTFSSNLSEEVYLSKYYELYSIIYRSQGKPKFIIDSSKLTNLGVKLKQKYSNNVSIVYLYRNILAIAASKYKWNKKRNYKNYSLTKLLLNSFFYQLFSIYKSLKVRKNNFAFIRYEDLVTNKHATLNYISKRLSLGEISLPELIDFTEQHDIGGSPNRFQVKEIKYDKSWEKYYYGKPFLYFIGKLLDSFLDNIFKHIY